MSVAQDLEDGFLQDLATRPCVRWLTLLRHWHRHRAITWIGGGAIAVQYFRLQGWVDSVTGLVAPGGLIFGCDGGRSCAGSSNFIEKNRDAGIDEVAKEVKEVL